MSTRTLLISSVFLFVLGVAIQPAAAQDPNRAFKGRIILSSKRFPQTARSPSDFTNKVRKLSKSIFREDKEDHSWTIHFAAFLKQPLNDVEYVIKFYELSGHSQQLLATSDQFNDERGQRTIISKIKLDKKQVGVNKQIMMTLENRGKVYAVGKFKIIGEGEHFSGKVDFSEDEAK